MNIDAAQRALDQAEARAERARTDSQRRSAMREVERCRENLHRAEEAAARKLEDQGYVVAGHGRRSRR